MSTNTKKELPGTSRQAEEQRLQETLAVVRDNLDKYNEQVSTLRSSIDDMQAHFHDDNPELINELENTYTMYDFLNNTLKRNERALKKPYFGRVDFHDDTAGTEETFYIGRCGVFKDVIHPVVIDWRAPVANVYYENGLGKCSYLSPKGESIDIDLQLKRTYEIENGVLQNIYDTETIANDDILTKYLSKNKQAVLGEIVATIQKEQNEIIRRSPLYNCLVQGVAGSGKTTVAMHRISYILYNYAEKFKPEDFYIVGSNRLLLNYITGVLPDLDVYGVRQMTMEQLFVRLLYEDWDEKKYQIRGTDTKNVKNMVKGRLSWFGDLEAFCQRLEQTVISRESIYINPKQFVEGFVDGKAGVHDRTEGKPGDPRQMVLLMDGSGMDEYLSQYPTLSIQSKINLLNEKLITRIKDEFLGKGIKYTAAERKAILKFYRGWYGTRTWKKSIYTIYKEFLNEQACRGLAVDVPDKSFDVYDLAALVYLYKRVKETEEISEAHHVVIDEAQDFGMMVYSVLKYCIKDCTYTIMGDVSQNIHFGYGLNDWEELKSLYISDSRSAFGILKKSYRNTVEISQFATKILHHGKFAVYPVEPIIRHGNEPVVTEIRDRRALLEKASAVCRDWQQRGLETIAVICRSNEAAKITTEELGQFIEVKENNLETAEFGNGIMVLPVEYTKGLEFDAVLILDPTREEYSVDDGHAKLLYVAATRALHELCVLHTGNLTGLIADPVPEKNVKVIADPVPEKSVKVITDVMAKNNVKVSEDAAEEKSLSKKTLRAARSENKEQKKEKTEAEDSEKLSILRQKQRVTIQKAPDKPAVRLQSTDSKTETLFGSMPETGLLRALGRSKVDQSIRWVTRQPDGLHLHSSSGVLRISPISGNIIRVTVAKNGQIPETAHPGIAVSKPIREWMYRESPKLLELKTDEICLQVDKSTGSIFYMTRDKSPLLAERSKESHVIEKTLQGPPRVRLYLDWPKNENLYGLGMGTKAELSLKGTARYISHKVSADRLPMVISERGYALLIASDGPVVCCDIPNYGPHIMAENTEILDYYFVTGANSSEIISAYEYLNGR